MAVYALKDPRDGRVRYVGQSSEPRTRLIHHLRYPHSDRLREWIEELRSAGVAPELRLLDGQTEREWILRLAPDLNVARGVDENEPSQSIKVLTQPHEKAAFIEASRRARQSLSAWVVSACVREAERQGVAVVDPVSKKKGGR